MILIKKYIIFTVILTLSSSFALANDCKKTVELYNKGTDSQNLSDSGAPGFSPTWNLPEVFFLRV